MHPTTLDSTMIADALAETYARSLFELAADAGTLDEVTEELTQIVDLLCEHDRLRALFELPSVPAARRAQSLANIFKGRVSDLTYRFLGVLNDRGRLGHLASIAMAFGQRVKDHHGEVDVYVVTARELTDEQRRDVGRRISQAIDRQAILHARVAPGIIGGLTLRIGDRQIDGSIASQLRRIKKQLIDRGREAARQTVSEQ